MVAVRRPGAMALTASRPSSGRTTHSDDPLELDREPLEPFTPPFAMGSEPRGPTW